MDSLIKQFPALKENIQRVMTEHRNKLDSVPAFQDFSDEAKTDLKNTYIQNIKQKSKSDIENIESDVRIKKSLLQSSFNRKKFPATNSAILSDEKLQIEILKQRAETLAMNQLDFNIVNYLKTELENGNIDYINYFRDSVKLNTGIDTDLRNEMSKVFNDVDVKTGVKDLQIEIQICSAIEKQIQNYKDIIDEDTPEKKIGLMYIENEIKKLESELIPA